MPKRLNVGFDWRVEKPERVADCESAIERALASAAATRWGTAESVAFLVTIGREEGATDAAVGRVCQDVLVGVDGEAPEVVDDSLSLMDAVDDALHDCGGHVG